MSGYDTARLPWLVNSTGKPVGVKEADGDETFIPTFSADGQSLLKPDGTLLAGQGAGYSLPVATAATLGGVKAGSGVAIAADGTLSAAGGGGSSAADYIAFTTTVPLLNPAGTHMPDNYPVAGALTFTPAANPVRGAYTFAFLKANGANVPDVSAFTEHSGSIGYLNTANILNIAEFFYLGGVAWVSWSQAAVPVAITTPTTVTMTGPTSGVINTASSNYTVGTDGTRSSAIVVTPTPVTGVTFTPSSVTLPAGTATATFTATSTTTGAKTIAVTNNGGLTNPSNITLTVAAAATVPAAPTIGTAVAGDGYIDVAFTHNSDGGSAVIDSTATLSTGQTATGTISPIRVTAPNGTAATATVKDRNAVGSSAASAASNSVTPASAVVALRLSPKDAALTEGGSAGAYTYVASGSNGFNSYRGVLNKAFQATTDGSFSVQAGVNPAILMQFQSANTQTDYASSLGYVFTNDGGTYLAGGAGFTSAGTISRADGDITKLSRVGSVMTASVARTATPTTFIAIGSWSGVSTGVLYGQISLDAGRTCSNLASSGLV